MLDGSPYVSACDIDFVYISKINCMLINYGSQVVIGCDGVNSVVSEHLGLKPPKLLSTCSIIGFTNYPSGHGLNSESIRMRRGSVSVGRIPMDGQLVYWFVAQKWTPQGDRIHTPKPYSIFGS